MQPRWLDFSSPQSRHQYLLSSFGTFPSHEIRHVSTGGTQQLDVSLIKSYLVASDIEPFFPEIGFKQV